MKTCSYTVCHMVPEQRVKTCSYTVCHMVPEQRVKTCTYQVCHMVAEKCVKQVPYTVCKPVHTTKTIQVTALRAQAGGLHGDPLRAAGCLQASSGAGLLPGPLL